MPPPPPLRTSVCGLSPHTAQAARNALWQDALQQDSRIAQSAATSRYALDATQRFCQWAHQQDIPAVICFPAWGWFVKFSRDERPGGILPAFTWRDVAWCSRSRSSPSGSIPVLPTTERLSFFSPSHTRRPIGVPCGSPSLVNPGRPTGLPRSVQVPVWVRSCLFARGSSSVMDELGASIPDPLPFWPRPVSIFGLSLFTTFTSSSHEQCSLLPLTIPHHSSP